MNKKEASKALKEVIKGLEELHEKKDAGLLSIEVNYGSREVNPSDKEWHDNISWLTEHKKHDGNMTITMKIFNPNV